MARTTKFGVARRTNDSGQRRLEIGSRGRNVYLRRRYVFRPTAASVHLSTSEVATCTSRAFFQAIQVRYVYPYIDIYQARAALLEAR